MKFEPTQIHIEKGDIISFKKGMLQQSPIGKKEHYLVKKAEYVGGSYFRAIIKEPIDVKVVKNESNTKKK